MNGAVSIFHSFTLQLLRPTFGWLLERLQDFHYGTEKLHIRLLPDFLRDTQVIPRFRSFAAAADLRQETTLRVVGVSPPIGALQQFAA